jgi:NAD(P)H-hydrate epimerase
MTIRNLSREEARSVDTRAVEEFGMNSLVLMENAGRGVADVLCAVGIDGPVVICCGKGNNGGDGFVTARHLEIRGYDVKVLLLCQLDELSGDAAANYQILEHTETPVQVMPTPFGETWLSERLEGADWIVDALLGTGARGTPRSPMAEVIQQLNQHTARKLAVDLPSGLDCDTGEVSSVTFRADHTCTFVAPKKGFQANLAKELLGTLHVLDIGVPKKLLADLVAQ